MCIRDSNHLIAIVEAHDATGSDIIQYLENTTNYWMEMKDALIGNEDHVILNIANEWGGAWDLSLIHILLSSIACSILCLIADKCCC